VGSGLIVAAFVLASAVSCGRGVEPGRGEKAASGFQKVAPAGRTYAAEDLSAIGFKESKRYDVTGLAAAVDARWGFWRPSGGQSVEYEVRFYASHEDAVAYGAAPAAEVTGPDAVLGEEEMTWKEGAKDRRTIIGITGSGLGEYATTSARYGDFAIYGNVVMLCEGRSPEHSLERCAALVSALEAAAGR